MRLAQFIGDNLEKILAEWEAFAASLNVAGQPMTSLALRDHARQILLAIAEDIESNQTAVEQAYKSKGFVPIAEATRTAAMTHGALRYLSGFDLRQLAAEFRALRASVLRLWLRRGVDGEESALYQMTRFNESIDQALAESIANYSDEVARSRDTFLAILGHDLRSPLSAIANSSLYLGAPGLLPSGAPLDAVRRIDSSAAKMTSMIRDLLVFQLETSGDLEGRFDSERLQQVLSNLLNNAIQHGARSEPVILSAHGELEKIVVQVKNQGRPIPPDQLQVIFNPLVQIPSELLDEGNSASTSLGLGLYIAHEIVVMHGGTMVAESSSQEGTVFRASLPRFPHEAPRAPA
jgi:signal transduction histidine kinase